MQTRSCRLYAKGDIRIENIPLPAVGPGEVLVNLGAGGICGSDLHYWHDGGFGAVRVREPIVLGHESAGTIIVCGDGVTGLSVGDKVALNPSQPCGECSFCAAEQYQHCLNMRFMGSAMRFPHEQGMFRDQLVMPAKQCHVIKAQIPFAEAALAEPLSVCLHAFARAKAQAGPISGKRVLVTGAGPIGALCVVLAHHFGASEIVVTDLEDAVLKIARDLGATKTINVSNGMEGLSPYSKDKGQFDLAFECSAAAPALRSAIETVRPLGTVIQIGVTGDLSFPLGMLVGKEINLLGTHRFHEEFAEAVDLINQQSLKLAPVVTHQFPLEEAQKAFETAIDRKQSVKVQLTFANG